MNPVRSFPPKSSGASLWWDGDKNGQALGPCSTHSLGSSVFLSLTLLLFPVSRLHCESESFKMDLILDVNIQIYPVDLGKLSGWSLECATVA